MNSINKVLTWLSYIWLIAMVLIAMITVGVCVVYFEPSRVATDSEVAPNVMVDDMNTAIKFLTEQHISAPYDIVNEAMSDGRYTNAEHDDFFKAALEWQKVVLYREFVRTGILYKLKQKQQEDVGREAQDKSI